MVLNRPLMQGERPLLLFNRPLTQHERPLLPFNRPLLKVLTYYGDACTVADLIYDNSCIKMLEFPAVTDSQFHQRGNLKTAECMKRALSEKLS